MGFLSKLLNRLANKNTKVQYERCMEDLVRRGMKRGKNVWISPGARIDENYPYLISIGDNVVIGPRARLVAHDTTIYHLTGGYMRIGKIDIKDNCVISMNSIILPGVTIGPNSLVAAGSVVNKDVPPNTCVAGIPARFYAKYDELSDKLREEIKKRPVFESVDLAKLEDESDPERKKRMIDAVKDGDVFIKGIESKYPIWLEGRDRD